MNAIPIVLARLDWPSAIGSFLLSFGSLEYFSFVFLKDHLPENEFEKVKDWHLVDRLKRIAQYLAAEGFAQQKQVQFTRMMARLTPLREIRNQIAHGQMHVMNLETGIPRVVLLSANDLDGCCSPKTRELEFSDLEKALTEIAALNREFEQLVGFSPSDCE